jgi:hypothetical protein
MDQQLTGLAGLGDPLRRALYRYVAERGVPVSRDAAAKAAGISRPLAAYHLDKLIHDGLLEARYQRRSGRRDPGPAARPSTTSAPPATSSSASPPATTPPWPSSSPAPSKPTPPGPPRPP